MSPIHVSRVELRQNGIPQRARFSSRLLLNRNPFLTLTPTLPRTLPRTLLPTMQRALFVTLFPALLIFLVLPQPSLSVSPLQSTFITSQPAFSSSLQFPALPSSFDESIQNEEDRISPYTTSLVFDIPVLAASEDLSSVTAGAAWDLEVSRLLSVWGRRGLRSGILASDGSFYFQSSGSWLLNEDLNRQPLTARFHLDAGFELIPHPPEDIPTDLFIDDQPPPRWRIGDVRYHYRAAVTLESGVETGQSFDDIFVTAGAGLRLINLSRTGWSGWMPTAHIIYEGVFRVSDDPVVETVEDTAEQFRRLRIVYRHQLDLETVGLSGFTLAGGFQFTHDSGQPASFRDEGLHSRFGWTADLSRAIRWQGRDGPGRIDLFVRYSGGRIAPLITSDRSFQLGLRLPYSR